MSSHTYTHTHARIRHIPQTTRMVAEACVSEQSSRRQFSAGAYCRLACTLSSEWTTTLRVVDMRRICVCWPSDTRTHTHTHTYSARNLHACSLAQSLSMYVCGHSVVSFARQPNCALSRQCAPRSRRSQGAKLYVCVCVCVVPLASPRVCASEIADGQANSSFVVSLLPAATLTQAAL